MWSEEAMELRDVSLLNLILAGRRTSAPASAKHEDHHTEWATQGPLVFAMFRFKVSRSNRRRNQCMFARLRVLHVKTVYVFTRVCVWVWCFGMRSFCQALFCNSRLLLAGSRWGHSIAFWSVNFCVEVQTFQQRNQNYETFSSSLLAVRVGTLVEWRFAKVCCKHM